MNNIFKLVQSFLNYFLSFATYFSSIFFIAWLLFFFFPIPKELFFIALTVVIIIGHYSEVISKNLLKNKFLELIKRAKSYIEKTIRILGSFIFLILFFNMLLSKDSIIAQRFLEDLKIIESILNVWLFHFLVSIVISVVFIMLLVFFVELLCKIIKKIIKLSPKYQMIIGVSLVIVFYTFFHIWIESSSGPQVLFTLSKFLYLKFGWILGFSLLYLHSTYLVNETMNLMKKQVF